MKQIKTILPFLAIVLASIAFYYAKSSSQLVQPNKIIPINEPQSKDGFWSNLRQGISNAKNSMKYNIISFNSTLDLKKFKFIQIFDKSYNLKCKLEKRNFEEEINFITWMTYRSNFDPIESK